MHQHGPNLVAYLCGDFNVDGIAEDEGCGLGAKCSEAPSRNLHPTPLTAQGMGANPNPSPNPSLYMGWEEYLELVESLGDKGRFTVRDVLLETAGRPLSSSSSTAGSFPHPHPNMGSGGTRPLVAIRANATSPASTTKAFHSGWTTFLSAAWRPPRHRVRLQCGRGRLAWSSTLCNPAMASSN